MKSSRRSKKEKGVLYGEGSFGCVFTPSPKCEGNETFFTNKKIETAEVAKLFVKKEDYELERDASLIMANIDKKGKTLMYPNSGCTTTYKKVFKVPVARGCDELSHLKMIYGENAEVYMMKMPYGGIPLDKYVRDNEMNVKQFLKAMLPVYEGISKIRRAKYCHQDIKSSNVLMRTDGQYKDQAWIIDYSLIEPLNKVYNHENRRRLRHTYFPYPPEYKLYTWLKEPKNIQIPATREDCVPFEKVLENIFHFGNTEGTNYFKFHDRILSHSQILEIYYTMVNIKNNKYLTEWLTEQSAPKVDIYGTGMVHVELDKLLSREGLSDAYLKKYNAFIAKCTHPDFRKRYTAQGAYTAAKKLAA